MAKLLSTQEVRISEIDVSGRLRPVSELAVISLMASIEEIGLQAEIHVRKVRHQDGRLKLIAGGHRIEAQRRRGCETIATKIWDCTDDWAAMAEIDDNLAHADLGALDLAVFLAERKTVYERMYPDAKHGGVRGNQHTGGRQNDVLSFCQSVAEQKAMSKRQIERLVAAGQGLDAEAIELLRRSPNRITLSDLQTLGSCGEQDARRAICTALATGTAKNAAAALKAHKNIATRDSLSVEDRQYGKISDAWARSGKPAKRQFVAQHAAELRALRRLSWSLGSGPISNSGPMDATLRNPLRSRT